MTRQETFDFVCSALLKQGKPSLDARPVLSVNSIPMTSCGYRGVDGTKCAAGYLIPDEEYDPDLEGATLEEPNYNTRTALAQKKTRLREIVGRQGHDLTLVYKLQKAHDNAVDDSNWLKGFRTRAFTVAQEFGLSALVLAGDA